jgi:hypothetical protein
MMHRWIAMNEVQGGKLRRVGSVCFACGCRMYGWGGWAGPCVADIA